MLKYFEGEDKVFREAETNKMEVKQMKNLGYEGGEKAPKKKKPKNYKKNPTTIPLCRGRASQRKRQKPIVIQKRTKYTTRNNLCPPERSRTKITLKKTSHPLGFSEFLK